MSRNFDFSQAANQGVTVLPDVSTLPAPNAVAVVKQVTGSTVELGFVDPTAFAARVLVAATPPPAPADNALWWDSTGTGLYVRYNDGSSTQWVTAENQNTLADAPADGGTYGRKNSAWVSVSGGGAGVSSFNTRSGAVTLSSADVTSALTFTPAPVASPVHTGTLTLQQTVAPGGGTNVMLQIGDTAAGNTDPFVYSYVLGSTNGALGQFGLNCYMSTAPLLTRINTTRNAWAFQHDVRNAVIDGTLLLRQVSSAGVASTAITFDTTGGLTSAGPIIGGTLLRTAGAAGPTWTAGTGAPASTQPNGSLYSRTDGTTGTRLYVSSGGGTWLPVAAV
jgi:hypothetical protein